MPNLSLINPIHAVSYYFFELKFTYLISVYTTLLTIRAKCLMHFILLYLTTPTIIDEEY